MELLVLKRYSAYQLGVFLSSLSMAFGLLREFLIVGLLGFTAKNDALQIYLSVFYTIGLTIDAMRLSCLNLFNILSLPRIVFAASLIGLPFASAIGLMMYFSTHAMDVRILILTILGSYFNLIAALLITYKQRNDIYLAAQIINVVPNFILIPGILLCYWMATTHVVLAIVLLTSLIPIVQCFCLLLLPHRATETITNAISLPDTLLLICRHFSAMVGEQLLQVITRAAFFNYGAGYLSLYAMAVRIYAALRFILIDSYIGSKLASWQKDLPAADDFLNKLLKSMKFGFVILLLSLIVSLHQSADLIHSALQMIIMLIFGFYFSTLVRIVYFKINRHENNARLVLRFASYEMIFFLCALLMTNQQHYSLLALLWLGYIAKPFTQLLFLRKRFYELGNAIC